MWMSIKRWMWRRGLGWGPFYSPSAAMVWKKGTIFRPGKNMWADIVILTPNEIRIMSKDD